MPENPECEDAGFRTARQASGPQEEWRQWTAADGRKAQEAAFVSCDNGIVQVLTRSGQRAKLPLDKLSEADRQYVASKETCGADLFEIGEPGKACATQHVTARETDAFMVPSPTRPSIPWAVLVLNPAVIFTLFKLVLAASGKTPLGTVARQFAFTVVATAVLVGVALCGQRFFPQFFLVPEDAVEGQSVSPRRISRLLLVGVPVALLFVVVIAALAIMEII